MTAQSTRTTRRPSPPAVQALLLLGAALGLAAAACSKQPPEPEPAAQGSAAPAAAVTPLTWDAPPAWTALPAPKAPKKATYKVPPAGGDKEEAEVNVVFFGTGAEGDPEKRFKEMFGQFDGDVGSAAARESFEVRGMKVELVDTMGTFKMGLAPPVGPKKQAPVSMVKQGYRLHAAVVRTADRGNWFFRMTGPDATVQAARSAFRSMLESVK